MTEVSSTPLEIQTQEPTQAEINAQAEQINNKTILEIAKEMVITKKELTNLKEKNKKLEEKASLDPLTNILNRRGIEETFERVKRVLKRKEEFKTFGILFVDAVGLKELNESKGYKEGDNLLKEIAESMKNSIGKRGTDIVGRPGGDEFVLLSFNLTEESLYKTVNVLRDNLKNGIQLNIGAGVWGADTSFKDAIEQASGASLTAKNMGKQDQTGRSQEGHVVYVVNLPDN